MTTVGKDSDLVSLYRQLDFECGDQHDRMANARAHEMELFVPTPSSREIEERSIGDLRKRVTSLPAPDPVFAILKSHMLDFLDGQMSMLQGMFDYPSSFVGAVTHFISSIGGQDSRSAGERLKILLRRLSLLDDLWSAVRDLLPGAAAGQVTAVRDAARTLSKIAAAQKVQVPRQYEGLSDKDLSSAAEALDALSAKAAAWTDEAGKIAEASPGAGSADLAGAGPVRYREVLDKELGVSLDELLSWYEDEVNKTRAEFVEAAAKLNIPGRTVRGPLDAVDIMNTYAGPCDTPEEMFGRLRKYMDRAQKAARDWVRLPEETCRIIPVPEQYRLTYPWGGYGLGCPRRRPLMGEVFLNDTNFRAITDGWIKINAVHECYPGHHVQWVRWTLDPLPETVKLGAKRVPMHEGMCHRTERLMEYIYDDDPYYPLAVAYRRHHTSVRIKADLYLHYFERPLDDAIKLYMDEMGFDRETARGQAVSQLQQNRVGYFTCYYYGMKKLEDLERAYGYDKKTFTEYLFSVLNVSLANFEAFLRLEEDDKRRFLNDFPSKIQFA